MLMLNFLTLRYFFSLHVAIMIHTICTNQLITSNTHCFASSYTKRFITIVTHTTVKLTSLALYYIIVRASLVHRLLINTAVITVNIFFSFVAKL